LAVGFWQSQTEIADKWKVERTYEPSMTSDQRESLYVGWKRAVERAKAWIQE
jgi:glycerol kinase